MGAEVVGGIAFGAEIDGSSGLGMVMINSIDRTSWNRRGKIAAIGEGEEKIHVLEAARAIGLGANLADSVALESVAVGAAVAPLVALLDSDKLVQIFDLVTAFTWLLQFDDLLNCLAFLGTETKIMGHAFNRLS
jgi:hypothetical protein